MDRDPVACVSAHTYVSRTEDYTEYLEVGRRVRAPRERERERERVKKRAGGRGLSTISSNQAKANYKFNSELCTGDN